MRHACIFTLHVAGAARAGRRGCARRLSRPSTVTGRECPMETRSAALDRARDHAVAWLSSMDDRAVHPSLDADELVRRPAELPDHPTLFVEVVCLLAEICEPGLVAIPSGRFFGMVV